MRWCIWSTLKSPHFWRGFTHAFDLFPVSERIRVSSHRSDGEAIASDWLAVGGDMRKVLSYLERRLAEERGNRPGGGVEPPSPILPD